MKSSFRYLIGMFIIVGAFAALVFVYDKQETLTIRGALYSEEIRKGGPLIDSDRGVVFISSDFFRTPVGSPARAWFGKNVEATGTLISQKCGIYDQCAGDMIQSLTSIESITLISEK